MFAFQIAPDAYSDSDEYIYSTETLTDLHHIQQFFNDHNSRAKYKGYYINFSQCASPRPLYRIATTTNHPPPCSNYKRLMQVSLQCDKKCILSLPINGGSHY